MNTHGIHAIIVLAILLLGLGSNPLHAQLDQDDFESYAIGSTISGQGSWDTWDQAPRSRFHRHHSLQLYGRRRSIPGVGTR
ncbi:MAG: hypothetical protein ACJ0DK_08920 [Planctomycetota bacterium]